MLYQEDDIRKRFTKISCVHVKKYVWKQKINILGKINFSVAQKLKKHRLNKNAEFDDTVKDHLKIILNVTGKMLGQIDY